MVLLNETCRGKTVTFSVGSAQPKQTPSAALGTLVLPVMSRRRLRCHFHQEEGRAWCHILQPSWTKILGCPWEAYPAAIVRARASTLSLK